jgi:GrpB-like predicted nucleotidyltransferase (UPF0157 family)
MTKGETRQPNESARKRDKGIRQESRGKSSQLEDEVLRRMLKTPPKRRKSTQTRKSKGHAQADEDS